MRILDINNNEVLNPDLSIGYLIPDIYIIHHESVTPIQEEGYYEVIREYPNGGKDVQWIVTKPGREAQAAWDEKEDIERYLLYTQEELDQMAAEEAARQAEIEENARLRQQVIESAALINALLGVTEE